MADPTPLMDWAASGAMALTGRPEGPPVAAPGSAASWVRRKIARLAEVTGATDCLPGVALLGERAAITGFRRRGPLSCGGATRTVPTVDGNLVLSLPRPSDVDLVPALVESGDDGTGWDAIAAWANTRTTEEALERAVLLGLAAAGLPIGPPRREPVVVTPFGPRRHHRDRPVVVDFTSLWAGPLCAHLLRLAGAEVVKVESTTRLDGSRSGPAQFFDLLHAGHRMVTVDLKSRDGVDAIRHLVEGADLVLDSSRARAFAQLGIDAAEVAEAGTSWLSITAYGRDVNRIGFGDDVAVGAGLHVVDGQDVLPCGDALADPLTGVTAAVAAAEALRAGRSQLVDVSMHDVARAAARGPVEAHQVSVAGGRWWVECDAGSFPVAPPTARPALVRAGGPGADNAGVLG